MTHIFRFPRLKGEKKRRTLAGFFLRRYVMSLVAVSVISSAIFYWLLYSVQTSAINMSLETTEDFILKSVQYNVRNYEFEALEQSIGAFLSALEFKRIEVVGPYGKAIADVGQNVKDVDANKVIPIVTDNGGHIGDIRIWYSQKQHAWDESNQTALAGRIIFSMAFFLVVAVGYSLFFFFLIRRHFNAPLKSLIEHMNKSQRNLHDNNGDKTEKLRYAHAIPEELARFEETSALSLAYHALENRWIEADDARSKALANERYQRSMLHEVLQIAKITIAFVGDDGCLTYVGQPLPDSVYALLQSTELNEGKMLSEANKMDLRPHDNVTNFNNDQEPRLLELEDEDARKWSLHMANIDGSQALIMREVTQERSLEQALLRSEKLKAIGTLSSSIAHDFNNVISTILMNLELIKNITYAGEPVPHDLFEGIEASATGVAVRISDIRRLALEDEVCLEVVDQCTRLSELEVFIAPTLGADIDIEFDIQDRSQILCNGHEFMSSMINLIVNAKQAMEGRGRIKITTRHANERDLMHVNSNKAKYLAIDIEDSGPGVPSEIANLIFDPFYSTRKLAQGTGLGLAQVQAFCVRAGGAVYLDRHRGKGATFTLLFPISTRENSKKAPIASKKISSLGMDTKVFVLDDNEVLADTTARLLRRFGISADHFTTLNALKEASEKVELKGILLSDVHMPDCNFREVMEFVKSQSELKLAFYSGNEESLAGIKHNYPELPTLLKPFKTDALIRILQNLAGVPKDHLGGGGPQHKLAN